MNNRRNENNMIKTTLSFVTEEEFTPAIKKYMVDCHSKCGIKQRSLVIVEHLNVFLIEAETIKIYGFIHNTTNKSLILKNPFILLYDESGRPCASYRLNRESFGVISPCTTRPWLFVFKLDRPTEEMKVNLSSYSIGFERKYN